MVHLSFSMEYRWLAYTVVRLYALMFSSMEYDAVDHPGSIGEHFCFQRVGSDSGRGQHYDQCNGCSAGPTRRFVAAFGRWWSELHIPQRICVRSVCFAPCAASLCCMNSIGLCL